MPEYIIIVLVGLFVINLGLIAWAITDLLPRESVKYLPKTVWIGIIAFIFFGSVIYLLAGRGGDDNQG